MTSDPYPTSDQPPRKVQPTPAEEGYMTGAPAVAAPPAVNDVHFTRTAALWSALIGGLLILIVLLIFIAQNTESAAFTFFGWNWSLPLGVAILLAAVLGALIAVLAGAARIFQLRRAAKKNYKAATR